MRLTGEQLYALWMEKMELTGCEVDGWHELEEFEQHVWDDVAYELRSPC